jgi:hypothetical protein
MIVSEKWLAEEVEEARGAEPVLASEKSPEQDNQLPMCGIYLLWPVSGYRGFKRYFLEWAPSDISTYL